LLKTACGCYACGAKKKHFWRLAAAPAALRCPLQKQKPKRALEFSAASLCARTWRFFSLLMMLATSGSTSESGPSYWNSSPLRVGAPVFFLWVARTPKKPNFQSLVLTSPSADRGRDALIHIHHYIYIKQGAPFSGAAVARATALRQLAVTRTGRLATFKPRHCIVWIARKRLYKQKKRIKVPWARLGI
jgi:hypothetical protein